jgi:hypothetical protein
MTLTDLVTDVMLGATIGVWIGVVLLFGSLTYLELKRDTKERD